MRRLRRWLGTVGVRAAAQKDTLTAVAMQEYFGRIADDIRAACADGRLSCGELGLGPGVPPLQDIDRSIIRLNLKRVLDNGYRGFAAAAMAGDFMSTADPDDTRGLAAECPRDS